MPYIKGESKRKELDILAQKILDTGQITGNLNYLLFKLCKLYIGKHPSYNSFKNFIGELEMAKFEIIRRQVNPYEQEAMKRNGDID